MGEQCPPPTACIPLWRRKECPGRKSGLSPPCPLGVSHLMAQALPGQPLPAASWPSIARMYGSPPARSKIELGLCLHTPSPVLSTCSEPEARRGSRYQATSESPALGNLPKITRLARETLRLTPSRPPPAPCLWALGTQPSSLPKKLCAARAT